ncbi:MAG: hypothetical protein QM635_08635 [Microbacteriaceae bacterium]
MTLTQLAPTEPSVLVQATPSPTPSATSTGLAVDEDAVSPGWIGFAVTFVLAVAVVLLITDMTRRLRRLRYRAEIRERLQAERGGAGPGGAGPRGPDGTV